MVKELDSEEVKRSLVIKGVERIESIVTRDDERVPATLATWQCSRLVRRDYYLMCYKMFLLSRKETAGQRIERRLRDLTLEELAISALATTPVVIDNADASTFTIRVVSSEARVLLNVLLSFDQALSNLIEVHGTTEAMEMCAAFFAAFGRLKQALFKVQPEQVKVDPVSVDGAEQQSNSPITHTPWHAKRGQLMDWLKRRFKAKRG